MTVSHKEHHFVPRVYLKQWTQNDSGNIGLYTLNLKDKFVRKQITANIAKRKNLYTLPLIHGSDTKITETILFKIHEDNWPNILNSLDNNSAFTPERINGLIGFVINQSIRTPKFGKETSKIKEAFGMKAFDSVDWFYHGVKMYPILSENCTVELFYSLELKNFITSDNPATHWLVEGETFNYLEGIAQKNELMGNPNYKIICPLTPRHFAILTPNLGISIPQLERETITRTRIDGDKINFFNHLTEMGADKILFAKTLTDLI